MGLARRRALCIARRKIPGADDPDRRMNGDYSAGRKTLEVGVEDVDVRIVHLRLAPEAFDLARKGHLGAHGKLLDPEGLVEEDDGRTDVPSVTLTSTITILARGRRRLTFDYPADDR